MRNYCKTRHNFQNSIAFCIAAVWYLCFAASIFYQFSLTYQQIFCLALAQSGSKTFRLFAEHSTFATGVWQPGTAALRLTGLSACCPVLGQTADFGSSVGCEHCGPCLYSDSCMERANAFRGIACIFCRCRTGTVGFCRLSVPGGGSAPFLRPASAWNFCPAWRQMTQLAGAARCRP